MEVVELGLTPAAIPEFSNADFPPVPIVERHNAVGKNFTVKVSEEAIPFTRGNKLLLFGEIGLILEKLGTAGGRVS